jgi:hypothetical protein
MAGGDKHRPGLIPQEETYSCASIKLQERIGLVEVWVAKTLERATERGHHACPLQLQSGLASIFEVKLTPSRTPLNDVSPQVKSGSPNVLWRHLEFSTYNGFYQLRIRMRGKQIAEYRNQECITWRWHVCAAAKKSLRQNEYDH